MQWTILLTIQKRWMPADEGFIHLHGITIHKLVVCNPITLWWFLLYVYRFMLMVDYYWILMDFEWIIYLLQQSNDQTTTSFIDHHPTLSQLSPILCEDQDSQKIVQQLHKPPSTYKNTQYPALTTYVYNTVRLCICILYAYYIISYHVMSYHIISYHIYIYISSKHCYMYIYIYTYTFLWYCGWKQSCTSYGR